MEGEDPALPDEGEGDAEDLDRPLINVRPSRAIALILGLAMLYAAATFVDIWLASTKSADGTASAALVLGAAQYNGTPSPVLVRRLDAAAQLYRDQRVAVVVVTGGRRAGDITTEAKAGYDYLRREGIPDGDLRLEVQGDSTYTSLAAASRFLRNEEIRDVILVTDAYHARRVSLIADEVGLTADVSAVGDPTFRALARETAAVSAGRLLGFRRLDALRD